MNPQENPDSFSNINKFAEENKNNEVENTLKSQSQNNFDQNGQSNPIPTPGVDINKVPDNEVHPLDDLKTIKQSTKFKEKLHGNDSNENKNESGNNVDNVNKNSFQVPNQNNGPVINQNNPVYPNLSILGSASQQDAQNMKNNQNIQGNQKDFNSINNQNNNNIINNDNQNNNNIPSNINQNNNNQNMNIFGQNNKNNQNNFAINKNNSQGNNQNISNENINKGFSNQANNNMNNLNNNNFNQNNNNLNNPMNLNSKNQQMNNINNMNNMNNNQLSNMNNNQINQASNLTQNQINQMSNNQINQLSNNQINQMSNNQINQMSNNQINQMSNNQMNPMGINQLNPMSNNQINQLSNMNAMNNNNMGMQNINNAQPYSFSRYTKAPLTGLKNLGDTSYFNSVLQLLGTSRSLSSYFVNPKNQKEFEANAQVKAFTYVVHRLFTHLYPYPEKQIREIYKPDSLLTILGKLNQVYNSIKRRNPNDLINYILIQLHRELNQSKTKFISKPNPSDKNQVIKVGQSDFIKSNISIISNIFHWFEIKDKKCKTCNRNYYEFKNFETLELDLSEAFNQLKSPFNLSQCLNVQSHRNQKAFCQKCQKYTEFQINSRIYSTPVHFIFSLNRGNLDPNLLNINFIVEEKIDLSQYVENKMSNCKFELQGIVSISSNEQKYVCFGKSPVDKQWYIYNDDNVNKTDISQVITYNNNNAYIPCILLYHFIK